MGVTGQSTAIAAGCGISAVTMGTPGPSITGTPQLKTQPRPVRLLTVLRTPVSTKTVAVTSPSSPVPQMPITSMKWIQDKTLQTITTVKQ